MKKEERLWEVDFLRGIAVLMMLVSNFVFDLSFFSYLQTANSFFWPALARTTAAFFLLLVGISLTLSFARAGGRSAGFFKYFKRGVTIFVLGLLITLATWYAVGASKVIFGILHLIGLGIILAYPFISHPYISLFTGSLFFAGGFCLNTIMVPFPWLIWLGLQYEGFSSVDFTPVFPWFGFILVGIFFGNFFFPDGRSKLSLLVSPALLPIRVVRKIGTKSLLIYFAHQPIFWSGFWGWQQIFS